MQAVHVVFLNRFLAEALEYLSGLLHLCPPAEHAGAAAASLESEANVAGASPLTPSRHRSRPSARRSLEGAASPSCNAHAVAAASPAASGVTSFMVLLDVEMQAPVLRMPRHSFSDDSLEVDLGTLRAANRIAHVPGCEQLVDILDVHLQEVRLVSSAAALPDRCAAR